MSGELSRFWAALSARAVESALQAESMLSYAQLWVEIEARANILRSLGARRVALALDNGVEWASWDLACLYAQVICVPVPGFFSSQQCRHSLHNAGIDLLIAPKAPALAGLDFQAVQPGIWRRGSESAPALPLGTAKVTYTSGTTGEPKGVCLDADTMLRVVESLRSLLGGLGVRRHLCVLPLPTLLENTAGLYLPLWMGAEVCVPPLREVGLSGSSQFDVKQFLHALHKWQPHSLILVPQMLQAWVAALEAGAACPASLRFIAVGGGHVPPLLLQRARHLGLPVYEGYGLSECASVVCLNHPGMDRPGSVGRPLPHVELAVNDSGEIRVGGAKFLGYVGEPEFQDELWDTGDLGELSDGFLRLHGRRKNQFVTAFGRNVNPEWVEAALLCPGQVHQAWVYGEAMPSNVAVLVAGGSSDTEVQAHIDEVNQSLPDYARIGSWLRAEQPFTLANGLLTANGRLRRAALWNFYADRIQK